MFNAFMLVCDINRYIVLGFIFLSFIVCLNPAKGFYIERTLKCNSYFP